jgi:hypothetical protein
MGILRRSVAMTALFARAHIHDSGPNDKFR